MVIPEVSLSTRTRRRKIFFFSADCRFDLGKSSDRAEELLLPHLNSYVRVDLPFHVLELDSTDIVDEIFSFLSIQRFLQNWIHSCQFLEKRNGFLRLYTIQFTLLQVYGPEKVSVSSKKKSKISKVMFDDKHQVFRDECARSMSVLDSYYEPLLKQNRGHLISGLIFCVSVCAFQLLAAVRNISLFATFKLDSPTKQNVDILSWWIW